MPRTTIEYEHPKGNFIPPEGEPEVCCEEIEFDLGFEGPDSSYGADADGNRGVYVPGYFYPESDAPRTCLACGHEYNQEEVEEIEKLMEQKANDYDDYPEPDYPEPEDYDE